MRADPSDNLPENEEEISDPEVLAYRIDGFKSGVVRVRRSELKNDTNLFEISRSAKSAGFDPNKSLNHPTKALRAADPHIERKIQYKLMPNEIKKRIKEQKITLESLAPGLHEIKSINSLAAQYILTLVTDQLRKENLWRDEDQDLTMSEAFPLSQLKTDPRFSVEDLRTFDRGTFLTDSDLTLEDSSADPTDLRVHAGLLKRPELAIPMLNNLMRPRPRDLYHQIATRMIDTHYFEERPEHFHLYRACYITSRGVEDEKHFNVLMRAGLEKKFDHYTFETFRVERIPLRKIIRGFIEGYFSNNPAVVRCVEKRAEPENRDAKNIWPRFFRVWDALTLKQKDALECVYVDQSVPNKAEAAHKLGITINSLISRLRTAVQRFKVEFWEFEGMSPKRLPKRKLAGALTHNGLWRYQSAITKAKLSRIDLKTNIKIEITWNKLPKSRNLDWKTRARIKAEIIENCPVPYFHETEYFDEMKPTIISFGRTPGNFNPDIDPDEGLGDSN